MKAIILCAGRGTRMGSLTDDTPKPMLTVLGKNLIEWKLEALPSSVTQIILIVGYKKEKIQNYFGVSWRNIPITYIEQTILDGTGGAIALCKDVVTDKAIVLMGDDIYAKEDLAKLAGYDFSILAMDKGEEARNTPGGKIIERDGLFLGLNEGLVDSGISSSLVNTGAYTIAKDFFDYPLVNVSPIEYGLPHTLASITKEHHVHVAHATTWIQITSPKCLLDAEAILK